MSYTVTIQPSGRRFEVLGNESVLDAALRLGIGLPYGCRNAVCGSCKGLIVSGQVNYEPSSISGLSDEELQNNLALLCKARPQSDLTIKVELVSVGNEISVKKLPCRVQRKQQLSHDVMALWLKLPASERLQFFAGQYIDILMSDGRHRSFSIANAPHDDQFIELHIRHIEGGDFTGYVFNELKEKAILRIEGPHGHFYLREDSDKDMILIAGGTGFAPIKGIIEHALSENIPRQMYLYWGGGAKCDLYMADLAQGWADEYNNIHFIPVLSEPHPTDQWQGRTGYVHEAVEADFSDLSGFDVYAGGPPAMVDAGKTAFAAAGLDMTCYYSDAFELQAPKGAS